MPNVVIKHCSAASRQWPACLCACVPLLLVLILQEAARLMAEGEYEAALPVALDAVKQVSNGLRICTLK